MFMLPDPAGGGDADVVSTAAPPFEVNHYWNFHYLLISNNYTGIPSVMHTTPAPSPEPQFS